MYIFPYVRTSIISISYMGFEFVVAIKINNVIFGLHTVKSHKWVTSLEVEQARLDTI
jgi:hypothetical protein